MQKSKAITTQVKPTEKNLPATTELSPIEKTLAQVKTLEESGDLVLAPDYSVGNAMKSARFALETVKDKTNRNALQFCSKTSLYRALLNMCILGLNVEKKQCWFIVYGNELTLMKSYFGTQLVIKRILEKTPSDEVMINSQVTYKGEEFDYDIDDLGMTRILKHKPLKEKNQAELSGAYCKIVKNGKVIACQYMDIDEIRQSWKQSKNYNATSVHAKFPQEMAKRTVINRTAKNIINASNDCSLLATTYVKSTDDEFINVTPRKKELENKEQGIAGIKNRIKESKEYNLNKLKEQEEEQEEELELNEELTNDLVSDDENFEEDIIIADDGEIIEERQEEEKAEPLLDKNGKEIVF